MKQVSKLKPIQTIHLAFCSALLVFAIVSTSLVKDKIYFDASFTQGDPLYPLFPVFGIVSIIAGIFLFKRKIAGIDDIESFEAKMVKYQVAFLIRCAFLEAAALMNTVGFLTTGNAVFLTAAILPFLALVIFRPTKANVTEALNLHYPETEQL